MAAVSHRAITLSAPLCFILTKYRKLDEKRLKITVLDFYQPHDISFAKEVTFVDENKAIAGLPGYATNDSDRIPTARLEAGDVFLFLSKLDRIDDNIGNIKGSLNSISAKVIRALPWHLACTLVHRRDLFNVLNILHIRPLMHLNFTKCHQPYQPCRPVFRLTVQTSHMVQHKREQARQHLLTVTMILTVSPNILSVRGGAHLINVLPARSLRLS